MMNTPVARISAHPHLSVGTVDPRMFGSFVEHLGRGVYGGIYAPSHPSADAAGFRRDVIELVRELGVTTVRYPGGNFVSAYDWRDGVGPVEERPVRLDPAWHSLESNAFGIDEFGAWSAAAGIEPMLATNLGTGTIRDALQMLEYTNHPGGTTISDRRRRNGREEPWDVRLWCLGNEMDGPWQIGHLGAREYGRLAARAGAAMRAIDPHLELVVCGSSNDRMATFATWEREVLEETIGVADYISCHQYFRYDGDLDTFLASGVAMDAYIAAIDATITHVRAATRSTRRIAISFDEWNVWDWRAHDDRAAAGLEWQHAPELLEDQYTAADAVVVGDLLISMLNRADIVKAASMAQLVNVIGPIAAPEDGPAWRQSIFHPFVDARRTAGGTVLRSSVSAPDTSAGAPAVSTSVVANETTGAVEVLIAHRGTAGSIAVEVDLRAFSSLRVERSTVLHHADPFARNSQEESLIHPVPLPYKEDDGILRIMLPAVSWASMSLVRATE